MGVADEDEFGFFVYRLFQSLDVELVAVLLMDLPVDRLHIAGLYRGEEWVVHRVGDDDLIAWLGSTQGIFRLDAESGTYDYFTSLGGISAMNASPLAVTPDGLLWYNLFDPYGTGPHGLVWFDGTTAGIYSAPRGGEPQWGGLPHAQIASLEVRIVPGGYELWMSCLSRGIAVLFVPIAPVFGDGFESGDTAAWSTTVP